MEPTGCWFPYVPTNVVLADLVGLRNLMIIFSIISILVLCVLIERVTHVVIRPVKEMTRGNYQHGIR